MARKVEFSMTDSADQMDVLAHAKRRAPAKGEPPQRSAVAMKLMRHLVSLQQGGSDFSADELRIAGELISVGAQKLHGAQINAVD
jgi:hypothetical protein